MKIKAYLPKVSVVTVVRNGESTIEKTILSIISQNYPELEYIVIDGKSSDNTNLIIERYSSNIDIYISEPDNGIFDAMNKAAKLASGDWIIYMNSGDGFYSSDSLFKLADALNSKADVIFAGAEIYRLDELETPRYQIMPGKMEEIWHKMPTAHQATIVRLSCQQEYKFDNSKYTWCADHDMLVRMYKDGKDFLHQEHLLCYFDLAGGQARDYRLFIKERWQLSRGLVPWYRRWRQYGGDFFRFAVRSLLPKSTILTLRRLRGTGRTETNLSKQK